MSFLLDNKKIELNNITDISSNITCIIEEMDLIKLSKTELLEKCDELGITKCKSKNKGDLIEVINKTQTTPFKQNIDFIIEDTQLDMPYTTSVIVQPPLEIKYLYFDYH